MIWWQSMILILLGGLIGFFFNRLGAKSERHSIEKRHLLDAIRGLLIEMQSNMELTKKPPEPALLPRLAKDMWNIHRSSVAELPLEVQEVLYLAYVEIDKVNAVVETRIAFSNRYSPGGWDKRYMDEAKKARKAIKKARDILCEHLKNIETMITRDNLVSKVRNVLPTVGKGILLKCFAVLMAIAIIILVFVAFLNVSDANDTSLTLALYVYIAQALSALITMLAAFFNRFKLFVGFALVFLVINLWGQLGILIS